MLENYIGKDEVVKLIEETAGMEVTFFEYPRYPEFLLDLNEVIKQKIKEFI